MSPDGPPFQPGLNNPTRSAYESEAMTPALDEYAAWKATAAAELERLHEVRVATIPDRVWKRLYVAGLLPLEAAQGRWATWSRSRRCQWVDDYERRG
jgi:hypothetical protein